MERICVGALLIWRDEGLHILLGRRSVIRPFYPNVWDLPGGHCEPGETPEQTLVRELREEIGVVPMTWRPVGQIDIPVEPSDDSMTLHVYEITAWTGTPRNRQPEEHDEVAWFTVDDACRLNLAHPNYPALFRRLASTA